MVGTCACEGCLDMDCCVLFLVTVTPIKSREEGTGICHVKVSWPRNPRNSLMLFDEAKQQWLIGKRLCLKVIV